MNNKLICFLAFSSGAALGVFASWRILKTKYERITQEEIESVKKTFSMYNNIECDEQCSKPTEKEQYEQMTSNYNGGNNAVFEEHSIAPYVITPEELGEREDYDTTTLYYYSDGVLTTLDDRIVEDVENMIGRDFQEHFGEYEDDSVCIRNEEHMCDYEILRNLRCYSDVKNSEIKKDNPQETED